MSRYMLLVLALVAVTLPAHCASRSQRAVVLDGRGISPGQQCRNRSYGGVCKVEDPAERCSQLKCVYLGRGDTPLYETYDLGPALQGTTCGEDKICIGGKCVADPHPPSKPVVINDVEYDCIDYDDGIYTL